MKFRGRFSLLPFNGSDTLFNVENRVLVASSHSAFADLLRLSLTESKKFRVETVLTAEALYKKASQIHFDVAILDADMPIDSIADVIRFLGDRFLDIKLVVFPPKNQADDPSLHNLPIDVFLDKPYYLPHLLATLDRLVSAKKAEEIDDPGKTWRDPELAKRLLKTAMKEYLPVAILIWKEGRLHVYQGNLNEVAPHEISPVILHDWDKRKRKDIVRFKRFSDNGDDYLIYGTALDDDGILVMVFEKSKSLTTARMHTLRVLRSLQTASDRAVESQSGTEKSVSEPSAADLPDEFTQDRRYPWEDENFPLDFEDEEDFDEDDISPLDEAEMVKLTELLSSMPSPDPEAEETSEEIASMWKTEEETEPVEAPVSEEEVSEDPLAGLVFPWEADETKMEDIEAEAAAEMRGNHVSLFPETDTGEEAQFQEKLEPQRETRYPKEPAPDLEATKVSQSRGQLKPEFVWTEPAVSTAEDTPPNANSLRQMAPPGLESISPGLSSLNYTFVLIPRLPHHFLAGDLSNKLSHWVPQLCLAYGWRLDRLSIRPQYMQWSLLVSPFYSPGNLVRVVREETSARIFKLKPEYKEENYSRDFWSPGYLAMSGFLPPTRQILQDFILQTRHRQGLVL